MSDQKQMWNRKHAAGEHLKFGLVEPRNFAVPVLADLKPGSNLLELGCGVGNDARYFSRNGIEVTATDFADVIIEQNTLENTDPNLIYEVLDIAEAFPYSSESFDAVYAHLAIHYFDEQTTQQLVAEVARVLRPDGNFYFICKSTKDPKYGEGEKIGPDTFERGGHIRHFFSQDYTKLLLHEYFDIVRLEESAGAYSDEKSAFVECWAIKRS